MRFGSLGPTELILIVLAIVMIFGASKLGDIGGALGKRVRDFKKASREDAEAEAERQKAEEPAQQQPAATVQGSTVVTGTSDQKPTPAGVGDYRPPDATS